jgi:murein DD-endopeptidase MepM/ murein hydrolase activator NlpD
LSFRNRFSLKQLVAGARYTVPLLLWMFLLSGSVIAQNAPLDIAIEVAIAAHRARPNMPFYYQEVGREMGTDAGIVYLELYNAETEEKIPGVIDLMVVLENNNRWTTWLPGDRGYGGTLASLPPSVTRNIDTYQFKPKADPTLVSEEALTSYHLPWEDGQWATVTRSYGIHGRGQIDFDISGLNIAAAKDGTIIYVNDSHTTNAYDDGAWWYWNTLIIQHDDYEYSLYGHLMPNSVPEWIKAACDLDYSRVNCNVPVSAGQVIGSEGNTGTSTNPHLHVEFGQQYNIIPYPDVEDEDRDGDLTELLYTGYVYAEQNIAFRGYQPDDVAAWPYGKIEQASHRERALSNQNIVYNGNFNNGTDGWKPSGQINWSVEGGQLSFLRLNTAEPPNWASFYQDLYYGAPAYAAFEVSFLMGNQGGAAKTVSVDLLNSAGRDYGLITCDFSLPPDAPMQPYVMRGQTENTWANIRVEFSVNPPDGTPAAVVDDIAVQYKPDIQVEVVECISGG